jgi:hypothetical protein
MSRNAPKLLGIRTRPQFVLSCFNTVFEDSRLHDTWWQARTLVDEINTRYQLEGDIEVKKSELLRVVNKEYQGKSTAGNNFVGAGGNERLKLFRHDFKTREDGGKQVKYDFFQVTALVVPLSYPTASNSIAWKDQNASMPLPPRTRQHVDFTSLQYVSDGTSAVANKKRKLDGSITGAGQEEEAIAAPSLLSSVTYWESGDSRKLFAPKALYGADCDVQNVVLDRIEKLEKVNCFAADWRDLVDGGDQDDLCSEHDIFILRHRSMYLACGLRKFVEQVTNQLRWTWQLCLEHAIRVMNDIGIETYSNWRPLARWHRRLAHSPNDVFITSPVPKDRLPPFFIENPDAMDAFKKYGVSILKELSVERMHTYVLETLIPIMMGRVEQRGVLDEIEQGGGDKDLLPQSAGTSVAELSQETKDYLHSYGLAKVSMATVLRWMHAVGFRYKNRSKHYFVDGHEKPETLAYRPVFTKRYLSHEVQAYRWIQLSRVASKTLETQDLVAKNCGYPYVDPVTNIDMVEYHVDAIPSDKVSSLVGPFGAMLSVRRDVNKPIVMFIGQDEAIFKQFSFVTKMWTGPKGERPLLPKDEGAGVMISSFIGREYGLINELDQCTLDSVNEGRRGARYADEEAAMDVYGSSVKPQLSLSKSPFLTYFDYGENKEGYWDYNHMVLQFEDVVDCLKVMHPHYHFVFLFDHSSGHAKQRPDGLNATRMNKSYGGKCPAMHPTVIERESGFLGPYPRILEPGQTQRLTFTETDAGPFWMTPNERILNRLDQNLDCDPATSVPRNKAELILELHGKGVKTKGKNKSELVALCLNHNIQTNRGDVPKIKEGWVGKAKGLLQVLWERGFIDTNKLSSYTLTGRKNELGNVDVSFSLKHIMAMCPDFLHEEGMMEHIGASLGVEVMLTPKCHAEIAGEGVEYMWACSKGAYRNLTLKEKRGKENFMAGVRHCLSSQVISVKRIRKFAKRARQYLIAYYVIDSGQVSAEMQHDFSKYGPVGLEKLIATFRTHRCAMDFDYKFVMNPD